MALTVRLSDVKRQYPHEAQPQDIVGLFVNGGSAREEELPRLISQVNKCAGVILVDGGANHFITLLKKGTLTVEPLALLGDLDSVSEDTKSYLKERFPNMEVWTFPRDKDFTDLEAALQSVKLNEIAQVHLFFANGGRLDHELGNMLYMCRKENRGKVSMINANAEVLQVAKASGYSLFSKKWQLSLTQTQNSPLSLQHSLNLVQQLLLYPFKMTIQLEKETIFKVENQECTFPAKIAQTISLIPINGAAYGVKTEGLNWNLDCEKFTKKICGISNIATSEKITVSVKKGSVLCILNNIIDTNMYQKVKGET